MTIASQSKKYYDEQATRKREKEEGREHGQTLANKPTFAETEAKQMAERAKLAEQSKVSQTLTNQPTAAEIEAKQIAERAKLAEEQKHQQKAAAEKAAQASKREAEKATERQQQRAEQERAHRESVAQAAALKKEKEEEAKAIENEKKGEKQGLKDNSKQVDFARDAGMASGLTTKEANVRAEKIASAQRPVNREAAGSPHSVDPAHIAKLNAEAKAADIAKRVDNRPSQDQLVQKAKDKVLAKTPEAEKPAKSRRMKM